MQADYHDEPQGNGSKKVLNQPKKGRSKGFRIGELAKLTGSTTRTLRYYEELGLLEPIRNSSGQRLYNETSISRLHFIDELKSGGFSLHEVKKFFESWKNNKTGSAAAEATVALVQQKISEINDLQTKLGKLHEELRGMVNFLLSCTTCNEKPCLQTCSECKRHFQPLLDPLLNNILKKDTLS